ncbi:MarR family transcriptional regulator [Sulfitobacter sp. EhC04]|uniref:MarR family winged helix-turn-helix transcriptional regulator n=1 Tax=Sulfitobacter sp. EhC04 TaxID=1849168 RepID=UPI0007F51532|nr:MarR family transcriptional regulator [Sulfitobacter sp. EhC04]OAN77059.1 MarR family transcriptional regulator [Sulfitobacter sp. EhC04]
MTDVKNMAGHLIRRLHQISTQTFARQMQDAGHDLTPVQFAALDAIAAHPETDQASIAAQIGYDKATIGGVIDRLEVKRLVTRHPSPHDRRARLVQLTEAGRSRLAEMRPIVRGLQDDILAPLTPEERATFVALAAKVVCA